MRGQASHHGVMLNWLLCVFVFILTPISAGYCLNDAVATENRRPVVDELPLLLATYSWEGSRITSSVAKIIIEERMGLQVNQSAILRGSHLGPPALAGGSACSADDNFNGCDVRYPTSHFIFDAWGGGEKSFNAMNASIQPIMGSMGYMGREGTFVPESALQLGAAQSPPVFMDFYKSYNSSTVDLTRFMASRAEVEAKIQELGLLKAPCTQEDIPQAHAGCDIYEDVTHDYGMYQWTTDTSEGRQCHLYCDNDWILSPACRDRPDTCVAWISTGDGWGVEEMMQQASFWNIALAIVVLPSWGDYTTLPLEVPSLWFWFFPDPAFMQLSPTKLQEPPTDHGERNARIFRTGADAIVMRKFQWRHLPTYAPQVHEFLNNVEFSLADITELMRNASLGQNLDDIACLWVRQQEEKWSAWLPQPSDCAPGWSFNEDEGRCTRCLAGEFSTGASSGNSSCQPCSLGTFSDELGVSACARCGAGRYAGVTGLTECVACPSGEFGSSAGLTECQKCRTSGNTHLWTTMRKLDDQWVRIDGATSQESCGCAVGARWSDSGDGECVACTTDGMDCVGMGELQIVPGYMSDLPVSIYKCFANPDACVGGLPGETCNEGRSGRVCAECEEGLVPGGDGKCAPCTNSESAIPIVAGLVSILVLASTYIMIDRRVRDPAAPSQALVMASIAFGQLVSVIQQLSVVAYFSLKYGEPLDSFLKIFTVFAFNVEIFRIGCVGSFTPSGRYILKMALMFAAMTIIIFVHFITVFLCFKGQKKEKSPSLAATIGVIMMALFTSIVVSVLGPLQCNRHPNGQYSMADYEAVVCWDFESHPSQLSMLAVGAVALNGPLLFFGKVCHLVYVFPRKMKEMDTHFMQCYGMLFFRLRQGAHAYLVVLITRALLIALIPIIRNAVAQIFLLQTILLASQSIAFITQPWRVGKMNYLDGLFTIGMLYFSNLASFSVENVSTKGVGYMVIVLLLASIAVVPMIILYFLLLRFAPRSKAFQFFLCHAKAETGCFCRLLKLEMQEHPKIKREIFLDADNLDDLDRLLSYVGNELDTLLVVLSRNTLYRAWCAGEITVAYRRGVETVPIRVPSYEELSKEQLASYIEDAGNLECLTESGLATEMIQQAITWVVQLPRLIVQSEVCLKTCYEVACLLAAGSRAGLLPAENRFNSVKEKDIHIAIAADLTNIEACASAGIVRKLLSPRILLAQKNQVTEVLVEGMGLPHTAFAVVLVGTNGCMVSPFVAEILMQASERTLQVLPIVCEDSFNYPSPALFKNFPEEELPTNSAGQKMTKVEVSLLMQDVFKEIAIVMRTRNSPISMLTVSANEAAARLLARRVHRLKASSYFIEKASSIYTLMDSGADFGRYATLTSHADSEPENSPQAVAQRKSVRGLKNITHISSFGSKFGGILPSTSTAESSYSFRGMHWACEF